MSNSPITPSRTKSTERQYLNRALWFEEHTSKFLGIANPGPLTVSAYAIERREEWSKSTWRQIKASLIFRYSCMGTAESIEAAASLRDCSQSLCVSKTKRTSGKRSKTIKAEDLALLIKRIRSMKSVYSEFLCTWVLLGSQMGLRPHEWGYADVIYATPDSLGDTDGAFMTPPDSVLPYLRIINAKNTNGRGHGVYRHLNLQCVSRENIEKIRDFSHKMQAIVTEGRYEQVYNACAKLLWRANRDIHGDSSERWIQLYSARHVFSSDAKLLLTSDGVAALMGHKTTKTASEHYGRRQGGSGSLGPRPIAAEINKVRKMRTYRTKRSQKISPTPSNGDAPRSPSR